MIQMILLGAVILLLSVPILGQTEQMPVPYIPVIESHHPSYPPLAMTARADGEVQVEATIDPAGFVTQTKVITGHSLLRKVTEIAISQWRFVAEPEITNVRKAIITYHFQITDEQIDEAQEVTSGGTPTRFIVKNKYIVVVDKGGCGRKATEPAMGEGVYWQDHRLKGKAKKK